MNGYTNKIARLCVALVTLVASFNSTRALARTDVLKHTEPTGDIGKMLLLLAAFVGFVVVVLTWIPDWISPPSSPKRHKDDEKSKKEQFKPDPDQSPWGN